MKTMFPVWTSFQTFGSSSPAKYLNSLHVASLLKRWNQGHELHYGTSQAMKALEVGCVSGGKELRSTDIVALEYSDLKLTDKTPSDLGHVRIRQHVNPLSSSFLEPAPVPVWNQFYGNPNLPLMVDIGCGSGRFLIWLAQRNPNSSNYLGLEIRQKLVKRAELWVKELTLDNVGFIFANATVSFRHLVESYPGPIKVVSILCPDPHFKKRHKKRRVVQKHLVEEIVACLEANGEVFIQSDVMEVAVDMRDQFDDIMRHVDEIECDEEGWLLNNPMGIRTEREIHAEFEGAKIYRRLYRKHSL